MCVWGVTLNVDSSNYSRTLVCLSSDAAAPEYECCRCWTELHKTSLEQVRWTGILHLTHLFSSSSLKVAMKEGSAGTDLPGRLAQGMLMRDAKTRGARGAFALRPLWSHEAEKSAANKTAGGNF